MDTSNKKRVLVTMIAAVMVLSSLAILFENAPGNNGATGNQTLSYLNGVTNSGNVLNDQSVAPVVSTAQVAAHTYSATFTGIGLPTGDKWSITIDGADTITSTTTSITFQLTNGSHTFEVGKPINYVADPANGVVFVYGAPSTQYITFSLLEYTVSFVETGLPSGSSWSVDLNGTVQSTTTDEITYSMPNGSYSYSISGPTNYAPDPQTGKAVVYGSNVTVDVSFATTLHKITFNFNGDISGQSWTLQVAGDSYTVTGSSLTLMKNNGVYAYSVTPPNEYSATPSSGSVLVIDKDTTVNVTILQKTYTVTFEHVGIDVGTVWKVTLNGVTESSNSSIITFVVPTGVYNYTIEDVNGYAVTSNGGNINVNSQDQVVNVQFSKNPDIWRSPLLILAGAAIGIAVGIGAGVIYVRRK